MISLERVAPFRDTNGFVSRWSVGLAEPSQEIGDVAVRRARSFLVGDAEEGVGFARPSSTNLIDINALIVQNAANQIGICKIAAHIPFCIWDEPSKCAPGGRK